MFLLVIIILACSQYLCLFQSIIDGCFEQLLILLLVFMSVLRTHSFVVFILSIDISFLEVINFLVQGIDICC